MPSKHRQKRTQGKNEARRQIAGKLSHSKASCIATPSEERKEKLSQRETSSVQKDGTTKQATAKSKGEEKGSDTMTEGNCYRRPQKTGLLH
ncbi:conserved hypothetical protein [Ricinus communis]|uniref:Uncharacterized protein n=1 Tax=Ricinus communis TaxID=3988 RepID=B9T6C4_RICCO|nr:conserved hypothetical protein [Ricinus communis]